MSSVFVVLLISVAAPLGAPLEVRLVGGNQPNEGRVEVYYNGTWGTVCDDLWDKRDGKVVCRMLDYPDVIATTSLASYGKGTGAILLDNVVCIGNETDLADCDHAGFGSHNCGHHEDAGVICNNTKVRLVGGPRILEGRVEWYHAGVWATVCDRSWDFQDATVVCRMLGYRIAEEVHTGSHFGPGAGDIIADVNCTGTETDLTQCSYIRSGHNNCTHSQDVGVTCEIKARLINGSTAREGRVEIYRNGAWGTVCTNRWDTRDGDVVCRMLGYGDAKSAPVDAAYGQGTGPFAFQGVECVGDEMEIENCEHGEDRRVDCRHKEDVGVECSTRARLVGGTCDREGRVEIYYAPGLWGTVCDDFWETVDGDIVCRMMGFPGADRVKYRAAYGQGSGEIFMDDVQCNGSEIDIVDCQHTGADRHNCGHHEDAGVVCSQRVRLAGGRNDSEGRVEIYHAGAWGTVCDDLWDTTDGTVVCRMLGYRTAVSAPREALFGQGAGDIILDNVECSGDESDILECQHPPVGKHNCNHSEDAGVVCAR